MQKRHFELIAKVLADAQAMSANEQQDIMRDLIIMAFANKLQDTNPLFKRERFLEACVHGVSNWHEPMSFEQCDDENCWCKNEEHTGEFKG